MEKPNEIYLMPSVEPDEGKVYLWLWLRKGSEKVNSAEELLDCLNSNGCRRTLICDWELHSSECEGPENYERGLLIIATEWMGWRRKTESLLKDLREGGIAPILLKKEKEQTNGSSIFVEYEKLEGFEPFEEVKTPAESFDSSGYVWAGDPCCPRGGIEIETAPGTWRGHALLRSDTEMMGNGLGVGRFEVWLEGEEPAGPDSPVEGEVSVDSARLCFRTNKEALAKELEYYKVGKVFDEKYGDLWDEEIGDSRAFAKRDDGLLALTFYGDGIFPLYVRRDENGKAVAMTFVTDPFDPLFHPEAHAEHKERKKRGAEDSNGNEKPKGMREKDLLSFFYERPFKHKANKKRRFR